MKLALVSLTLLLASAFTATAFSAEKKPLRALLVCGGCCHDYGKQHVLLRDGIQARANVQVNVIHAEDRGTGPRFPIYENKDWAKGYDVIIHDECAAGIGSKDMAYVQNILDAHRSGVPAVNLHCAMHSYRTGKNDWFEFIGLQSTGHGPQEPIDIRFVDTEHPITKALGDWTTIKEELYNNINVFGAHPLAMGKQRVKQKDGSVKEVDYIVAWTNAYGEKKTRVFSTTIGHNNDTVADARYLDMVTRGLLWSVDKLNEDYLKPYQGEPGIVVTLPKPPEAPKPAAAAPPAPAKDATMVKLTASSEESNKSNFAWRAVDGDRDTRWCASTSEFPQWLQLEFDKPHALEGASIIWESGGNTYKHVVEGSADGKSWKVLADARQEPKKGDSDHVFKAEGIRLVRIICTGTATGGWASIREVKLKGPGIKSLAAQVNAAQAQAAKKEDARAADPYAKEGNVPPKVVKLTPAEEAEILKDVKVADGFEATLFAPPQMANYPVFIAASPNGDVYVSSDGNGSLGRNPKRGRILRLRDKDGDGRADEVTEFVKDLDAPRGLVWDHDRLYVVHPPDMSVFIDKDGDGVAEERKTLVKGIAFGYKDRPADHTTNGLSLGIDGWLYIAGGDFGFMDAVGADGTHLQHRGGGVIRVRPDGTGLEIYATGTRNILEVAVSPTMDIFTRDNTNDGGGWNVRFHHFAGLGDHGYPRLYKNFADEIIQPLADYGGGSGCGAVYIDEPGFGRWNDAPFTADWGTGALWHHTVKRKGATYEETAPPQPFIKMTRPTDADVDGNSKVYLASWKGATFNWEGPNVGYIVCVKPKGFQPEPLPDIARASVAELHKLLLSESHVRRLTAQREILRRAKAAGREVTLSDFPGSMGAEIKLKSALASLMGVAQGTAKDREQLFASLGLLSDGTEPLYQAFAVRALEYLPQLSAATLDALAKKIAETDPARLDPRIVSEAIRVAARFKALSTAPALLKVADGSDPVLAHMAVHALAKMRAVDACFAALDSDSPGHGGALRALRRMHEAKAVDGLVSRLAKTTNPDLRRGILAALCRLHFTEGEWKGDSWGTRPDTRGPYYQPEAWSETPKIAAALKGTLAKATPEEASFLVSEMNRNRIQFNEALDRILTLAKDDPKLIPDAVGQLASAENIPAAGIPMLIAAAQDASSTPAVLAQAIAALAKTDSADGVRATLTALVTLGKAQGAVKEQESARSAFLDAPKLENHHQLLETEAEKVGTPTAAWADMALLTLSARTSGSPESRELSGKALDGGWQDMKRRVQILKAVATLKHNPYAEKVLAALDDPDKAVAAAAKQAANAMKLEKKTAASGPLVGTLKPEDVIEQVLKMKGDVALGEQLFARTTCVACHTTSMDQPQKGPYLGNIAQTYQRRELAQNILDPNKTIAQGFASELFTLKDGTQQMGFITLESADSVKVRNIAAQEFTYAVGDVAKRDKLPISMMPPGLVNNLTLREFASLLDYLEALSKK